MLPEQNSLARSVPWLLAVALVAPVGCTTDERPEPPPAPPEPAPAEVTPPGAGAPQIEGDAVPEPTPPPDRDRLGPLDVRWRGGPDGRGGGSGPVVVLLHGYGTRSEDLDNLTRALRLPAEVRYALPEAPVELEGGGRGWWRLSEADETAIAEGEPRDMSGAMPAGLVVAREKVGAMLRAMRQLPDVAPDQVAIAGFSQGAMLAMDVALFTEPKMRAVGVLAGTLVAEEAWAERYPLRRGMPVFVAHGRDDARLPFAMAERLRDSLEEGGLEVRWAPFEGGHSLPFPVLIELSEFLMGALELVPDAEEGANGEGAETGARDGTATPPAAEATEGAVP